MWTPPRNPILICRYARENGEDMCCKVDVELTK